MLSLRGNAFGQSWPLLEGKMAVDYYLELDGIKGEAQDKEHKDQIDVLSWSWGLSQSGTTHMGSGSGAGKVNVQDLSLTKIVDKATAPLIQYCTTGKHIASGKLTCYKASGDNRVKFFVLELKKIIVSSFSTGGVSDGEMQTENVSLNFGEYKSVYTMQESDGAAGPSSEFGWDIATHEAK
jgi:type VI secretion system secreted protein Hcp